MKTPLSGAFPVLPTPFRSNGAIDETDFIAIIRFALGSAVDGVVYPGVASEVDTLSEEERRSQVDLLGQGDRKPDPDHHRRERSRSRHRRPPRRPCGCRSAPPRRW